MPAQTQALIWGDLVPQMILSAKIPRWWKVTAAQVHWVGLHLRYGRELMAEAALDPRRARRRCWNLCAMYAAPARTSEVGRLLEQGDVKAAVERVTPSELFSVARELAGEAAAETSPACSPKSAQIARASKDVNYDGDLAARSALPSRLWRTPTSRNCSACARSPR